MRKFLFALLGSALILSSAEASGQESLRSGFLAPPAGGGAQTWWHWTSLFVTREGITADLESMKAIGYETAHLFTTSSSPKPPGDYPELLTPEWLDLLAYTGREAQRLGLTLGIHNCPGWSLSGGPWIKPEDAMQMLVSSETNVDASSGKIVLPTPDHREGYYRDIAVLAFPDRNRHERPSLTADFPIGSAGKLLDGDYNSYIRLPIREPGSQAVVTLEYETPYSPQFIELSFGEVHLHVKGSIEASADGKTYREAAVYDYKIRTDLGMPKYIRLNENARGARFFRVTFQYRPYRVWMTPANVRLNEIRLLASPMIPDVDSRNSAMEDAFSYKPFEADYTSEGIDPSGMLDLSDRLRADGTLDWKVPSGAWTILRIGHTPTGKTNGPTHFTGLECNKMDRRGLDAHWPEMMGKVIETLRPTGALKYVIADSYEAGGQNWTDDFEQQFLARRGYALRPYLPAAMGFVVGTPQRSARFLYDFQRTISELFAENYYDYFAELCHQNGLLAITEAYFGPFDYLRAARSADVPTAEFWINWDESASRMPASAAHFHGRGQVGCESFTTDAAKGRWQQDPRQLKEYGDRAWIQGISQLVMHSFVHQPFLNVGPGYTLGVHGSQLNRHNTWWRYGTGWVEYINRSQYLLQAGLPVSELLVLSGESAPNRYPVYDTLLGAGYNYDFCCVYDLYDCARIENGLLVAPSGATYDLLSLGEDRYLTLKTLRRVHELLLAGASVCGSPPLGSPSLSDDEAAYWALVEDIWGDTPPGAVRSVGRGTLVNTSDAHLALAKLDIAPGVTLPTAVDAIHRRDGDTDIYFLYNDTTATTSGKFAFRVEAGRTPEWWDAQTGETKNLAVWKRSGKQTIVPLTLPPHGSAFVVFSPGEAPHLLELQSAANRPGALPSVTAENRDGTVSLLFGETAQATVTLPDGKTKTLKANTPEPIDLSHDWHVGFPSGRGAPEAGIELMELISLSDHPDEGVRYFAGTATYTRRFALPKTWSGQGSRVVLDLGTVRNLAEVKVNGQRAALLWTDPFSVDITDFLQSGENSLELAVSTLWVNRLIGDARNTSPVPMKGEFPEWVLADRSDSGLGHYSYSHWKGWSAGDELQPSGLIGPVMLRCLISKPIL